MPDEVYTTPEDFLPSLATLVLPSGKKIYVAEAGMYHVRLTQLAEVLWTFYNYQTTQLVYTQTFPAGFVTDPVSNSFISSGKAYIEIDGGTIVARAELNRVNFDAAPLEALPSSDELYRKARKESDAANLAIDCEHGNALDKFFCLFGVSKTQGLIYTGIGILVIRKL